MASTMLQSMAKGMGVRTMIEGFTANGANGHSADGAVNPLSGVVDLIAPIVQRFAGKSIDTATLQAAVTAALEAERAKAALAAEPARPAPPSPADGIALPKVAANETSRG